MVYRSDISDLGHSVKLEDKRTFVHVVAYPPDTGLCEL